MENHLLNCITQKKTNYVPIWFMRQAGRYLPEFREIRKKNPNFIKLCLNSNLINKITLQPIKRFGLDGVIIFSDILMIPYGLGQKIEFKKGYGPILGDINLNNIINIDPINFIQRLQPIYKGIKKVKNNLKEKSLIGFVGAPWTLLLYMLNKGSPKNNFDFSKINEDKYVIRKLLKKIEEIICLHADKQIEAGADLIQIFDSWAGLLPKKELSNYCYTPTLKIVQHIKSKKIPAICFPKGIRKNYVDFCSIVKPDCISIDHEIDPKWIKEKLNGTPIQGGLNPKILLEDSEKIKKNTENYLNIFKDYPYIFNLGHGVLPGTKPETIEYVVQIIRNKK
ncbi:MAG: uroporphyrinogen decarboxylase [Pelagibacteraceae bacterium]|nr:uroporphyrinogen decarboxylase [Pelagibacteraceae bacterium]MDP6710398.1 uroporphyrinogen decarboxylase [Pelagibacteraceae bacterium]